MGRRGYDPPLDLQDDSEGETTVRRVRPRVPIQPTLQVPIAAKKPFPLSVEDQLLLEIVEKGLDFSDHNSEDIKNFDTTRKGWFETRSKQKQLLLGSSGILHILAKGRAPKGQDEARWRAYWNEQRLKNFLDWLSNKYPDPQGKGFFLQYTGKTDDKERKYPLGRALSYRHDAFVRAFLSLERPSILPVVLKQHHRGQRYVYLATRLNSPLLEDIIETCAKHRVDAWNKTQHELSPLHVVMEESCDLKPIRQQHSSHDVASSDEDDDSEDEGFSGARRRKAKLSGSKHPDSATAADIYGAWKSKYIKSATASTDKSKNAEMNPASVTPAVNGVQSSTPTPGMSVTRRATGRMEPPIEKVSVANGSRRTSIVLEPAVPRGPSEDQGFTHTQRPSAAPGAPETRMSDRATGTQSAEAINEDAEVNAGEVHSTTTVQWKDIVDLCIKLVTEYQKPRDEGGSDQIAKFKVFMKHYKEALVSDPSLTLLV